MTLRFVAPAAVALSVMIGCAWAGAPADVPLPKPKPDACRMSEADLVARFKGLADAGIGRLIRMDGDVAQTAIHSLNQIPPATAWQGDTAYALVLSKPLPWRLRDRVFVIPVGAVIFAVVQDRCTVAATPLKPEMWKAIVNRLGSA